MCFGYKYLSFEDVCPWQCSRLPPGTDTGHTIHHHGHSPPLIIQGPDMASGEEEGRGHPISGVWSSPSGHWLTEIGWSKVCIVKLSNFVHIIDFIGAPIFNETSEYSCVWCFSRNLYFNHQIFIVRLGLNDYWKRSHGMEMQKASCEYQQILDFDNVMLLKVMVWSNNHV